MSWKLRPRNTLHPTPGAWWWTNRSVQRTNPSTQKAGKYIHWINVLLCIHPFHLSIHPATGILCDFNHVLYVLFNTPLTSGRTGVLLQDSVDKHPHSRDDGPWISSQRNVTSGWSGWHRWFAWTLDPTDDTSWQRKLQLKTNSVRFSTNK